MTSCPSASHPYVFQSWDTASKDGEQNDYSVCTTWLRHDYKYYLIHVLRGRFDFPTLRAHGHLARRNAQA